MSPNSLPPPPPTPARASRSALRALGLTSLVFTLGTETLPFALEGWNLAPDARFGLGLLVTSQVMTGAALLLRREHAWHVWALYLMLGVAVTDILLHPGGFDAVMLMIPGFWLVPLIVLAMRSHDRRQYLLFTGVSTALTLVMLLTMVGFGSLNSNSNYLWLLLPVLQTLLFGEAVISTARARDAAVERRNLARWRHQRESALGSARREAARMLHDHVLHALHALSRAGLTSADMVREECRSAHRALTWHPPAAESLRVEDLIADDPLIASLDARLRGSSHPVPAVAGRALAAAAHEALRNVQRHAQASNVRVGVESTGAGVRVAISDDGQGFDPRRRAVNRLGVGRSIVQRLDDIGGHADVNSLPGSGTTVTLSWPRSGQPDADSLWHQPPTRLMRRRLTRTAWPGLVDSALLGIPAAAQSPRPVLLLLLTLAGLALGVGAAALLAWRAMTPWGNLPLLGTAAVLWAVNLWAVPTPPEFDFELWLVWLSSALVHLVVLSSRLDVGMLVTLAWSSYVTGGLWVRYHDALAIWEHSFVLITGPGDVLLTLVVLITSQHVVTQEAEAAQETSSRRAAIARMQVQDQLDQFWSKKVTQEAIPLLRGVAAGHRDPLDPDTQETARLLEAQLRDELVLGPDHGGLVQQLARVRALGWQVTSALSSEDSAAARRRVGELLDMAGTPHAPGQRITLSADAHQVRAVVFEADQAQVDRWRGAVGTARGSLDVDPDFVRLSIPLAP